MRLERALRWEEQDAPPPEAPRVIRGTLV